MNMLKKRSRGYTSVSVLITVLVLALVMLVDAQEDRVALAPDVPEDRAHVAELVRQADDLRVPAAARQAAHRLPLAPAPRSAALRPLALALVAHERRDPFAKARAQLLEADAAVLHHVVQHRRRHHLRIVRQRRSDCRRLHRVHDIGDS